MIKYIIDYTEGSGSGCDTLFERKDDALYYMNHVYSVEERKGLEVVAVEVGYLITMQVGDAPSRYVWTTDDVDKGGMVDCPGGIYDCYDSYINASHDMNVLKEYAKKKGYVNVCLSIEEVLA